MVPLGVMRPILFPAVSVNQRLPSGPAVIAIGPPPAVGMENSVMLPLGVMRPIWFIGLSEPEVAIRARCDPKRWVTDRCGNERTR